MDDLKAAIREIPDFPKPGILFYDITTLLGSADALRLVVDRFAALFAGLDVDKVVGIESRGFWFGPSVAYSLKSGFVPVRKAGKLPHEVISESYALEYGEDRLEMHLDGISRGERVLVVDDLLATGGTAAATARLVERAGGVVLGLGFIIELAELKGRSRLGAYRVESLLSY